VEECFGPFDRSHRLTPDGTVVIVPTPGHTPGHVSVIVVDGDLCYFLAGDTTYTQSALIEGQVDGVSPDQTVSLRTMQHILRLTQQRPTVYLPSHDPESGHRLKIGATVRANENESDPR
jgi:glyoxylase-like metal-dependent hydrolase (beta-lactamase superfamily II)